MIIGNEIPPEIDVEWFPIDKYNLVINRLKEQGITVHTSDLISVEDMLLIHTEKYLSGFLAQGGDKRINLNDMYGGMNLSRTAIEIIRHMVGGTVLGMHTALETGWAVNIGGGFHHATASQASGFCHINDIAIAIMKARQEGIKKAMIIDCDVHYGDGNDIIFGEDENVFNLSVHEFGPNESGDTYENLPIQSGSGNYVYLESLASILDEIFERFTPELILYQAGVDAFERDMLGGLSLTIDGMKERDRIVFTEAFEREIPIVATFGGGYSEDINDLAELHTNTCLMGIEINKEETVS